MNLEKLEHTSAKRTWMMVVFMCVCGAYSKKKWALHHRYTSQAIQSVARHVHAMAFHQNLPTKIRNQDRDTKLSDPLPLSFSLLNLLGFSFIHLFIH